MIAGIGVGVAAATKYTVGVDARAAADRGGAVAGRPRGAPRRIRGCGLVERGGCSARRFVEALCARGVASRVANPYILSRPAGVIRARWAPRAGVVGETKYGQDPNGGLLFYTESWTWTVGWIPALAAIAGAVLLFRRDRRTAWVLVPIVPLFIVYMGWQTRYFGRWMLPVLPIVLHACVYAGVRRGPRARRGAGPSSPAAAPRSSSPRSAPRAWSTSSTTTASSRARTPSTSRAHG